MWIESPGERWAPQTVDETPPYQEVGAAPVEMQCQRWADAHLADVVLGEALVNTSKRMSSRLQPAVPCLDDPDRVRFTTMTSHAVVANSDMIRGNLLLIGYLSLGLSQSRPTGEPVFRSRSLLGSSCRCELTADLNAVTVVAVRRTRTGYYTVDEMPFKPVDPLPPSPPVITRSHHLPRTSSLRRARALALARSIPRP
jgi:hypothetical protein